jgi:hypothetical protein
MWSSSDFHVELQRCRFIVDVEAVHELRFAGTDEIHEPLDARLKLVARTLSDVGTVYVDDGL